MSLPLPDDDRLRLLGDEGFRFACHPQVPCFNQCCRRLNLVLTPYDVMRLKNRLGITASEFLDLHTILETGQNGWPMPRLQMSDNAEGTCPFLSDQGCSVYEDRPGACRTYPMGRAAKGGAAGGPSEEAFFLVREDHCQGFDAGPHWTPAQWLADQGLTEYNRVNDLFLPIITRQAPDPDPEVIAKKMRMFFMACYNLDEFRAFATRSRLTQLFTVSPQRMEAIGKDDLELLTFAFDWLRMAIFGEATLQLRPEVAAARLAAAQRGQ